MRATKAGNARWIADWLVAGFLTAGGFRVTYQGPAAGVGPRSKVSHTVTVVVPTVMKVVEETNRDGSITVRYLSNDPARRRVIRLPASGSRARPTLVAP